MSAQLFYLDGPTLETAKSVFTDVNLTILASDGFYSNEVISREQVNGLLQGVETCISCASPAPTPPTTYTVTQNVDNRISGSGFTPVLGVDYVLSGNGYDGGTPTAGPVSITGPEGSPYQFTIEATALGVNQFTTRVPFVATNPRGTIRNTPQTVTNTLIGILYRPTQPATKFYYLTPCTSSDGSVPKGGYIERTDANKPSANQRYIATNTRPEQYFYYDPASIVLDNVVNASDKLEAQGGQGAFGQSSVGGQGLVINEVPGEVGCPIFNLTQTYNYELVKCPDRSRDKYLVSANQLKVYDTVSNDGGTTIYEIGQELQNIPAGHTEITGWKYIDVNGVLEGQPNFRGPGRGCPASSSYYTFSPCAPNPGNPGQAPLTNIVAASPTTDPQFSGACVGMVYVNPDNGQCYYISGETTNPNQYATATSPPVVGIGYGLVSGDCSSCSQGPGSSQPFYGNFYGGS